MDKKLYNKWNSRRWRVTVWAIVTLTILMIYSFYTRYSPEWLGVAIPILAAIPNVYIGAESLTKNAYLRSHGDSV
jgi:hypothetical protein